MTCIKFTVFSNYSVKVCDLEITTRSLFWIMFLSVNNVVDVFLLSPIEPISTYPISTCTSTLFVSSEALQVSGLHTIFSACCV